MAFWFKLSFLGAFLATLCAFELLKTANAGATPPGKPGCAMCTEAREQMINNRQRAIKAHLLDELKLEAPPAVNISPKAKIQIAKAARNIEKASHSAPSDVAQIFIFGEASINKAGENVVLFNISELFGKVVHEAVLKISLHKPSSGDIDEGFVHTVVKEIPNGQVGIIRNPLNSRRTNFHRHLRVPIDVLDAQRWVDEDMEELALSVKATYAEEDVLVTPERNSYNMYIEFTITERKNRHKRDANVGVCTLEMNFKPCCRYEMVINFQEAGWEFIQFPEQYNAFVCLGECDTYHPNRNSYSMLAATVNETVAGCCHPGEYDDLDVVYLSKENVLRRTKIPNMIAKTCVCA